MSCEAFAPMIGEESYEEGASQEALHAWYERLGFRDRPTDLDPRRMVRPTATPRR